MATICDITKDDIAALLGRPLSELEDENFDTYLNIAKMRLSDLLCQDVCKIDTDPGPADLKLVLARFFDVLSREMKLEGGISSKKVEDFTINYDNGYDPLSATVTACLATITKYSKCGAIRHGKVCHDRFRCL